MADNPPPAADDDFGPPTPCVLILTRGRQTLVPARIHPYLNEIDVFRLPVDNGVVPPWLDEIYRAWMYGLAGEHIPAELREEKPPKLTPGTVAVLVDFAGLDAPPQFPGQPPTPFVRIGPLADVDVLPLSALSEAMILPGMTLSAAVAPQVVSNLVF